MSAGERGRGGTSFGEYRRRQNYTHSQAPVQRHDQSAPAVTHRFSRRLEPFPAQPGPLRSSAIPSPVQKAAPPIRLSRDEGVELRLG